MTPGQKKEGATTSALIRKSPTESRSTTSPLRDCQIAAGGTVSMFDDIGYQDHAINLAPLISTLRKIQEK